MSDIAIRVEHLGKKYRIGGQKATYGSLRESLVKTVGAPLRWMKGERTPANNDFWALDDISFEVKQGEVVGIIGRNGAGKSTLLKVLSRITKPTRGRVELNGRVGSLLEVGTGFHPELTGRENVFLNGAILGMSRNEINRKFDEIVDFSEIEKFLDTQVKFYSSGMYVRLAFAVAAHLEPDILVVDEVLAVGDLEFQKKSLGKMNDVSKQGRTVLFVSHNMGAIRKLCKSAILLEAGHLKEFGGVHDVVENYLSGGDKKSIPKIILPGSPDSSVYIASISIVDKRGSVASQIPFDEPFFVQIDVVLREKISQIYVALHIHDEELNTLIFMRDFEIDEGLLLEREPGKYRYEIKIPSPLLVPGTYQISSHVVSLEIGRVSSVDYVCPFEIVDTGSTRGAKGFNWIGKINPPLDLTIRKIT